MKLQFRVWRPFLVLCMSAAIGASACPTVSAAQSSGNDQPGAQDRPASKDEKKADKSQDSAMARLRIRVSDNKDKPIGNASVYVRFNESGGLFHKDKLAELNFKTNQDGSVKVPEVPQGKILIQVIATGWHTFGRWYDVNQDEQSIEIKLDPPTRWY